MPDVYPELREIGCGSQFLSTGRWGKKVVRTTKFHLTSPVATLYISMAYKRTAVSQKGGFLWTARCLLPP
jgi:hypothetical protein